MMDTPMGARETPEGRSFLAQMFTDSRGYVLPYRIRVPAARQAHAEERVHDVGREPMPLVLLLHGAGERGDDNSAQLSHGVAELLGSDTAATRFPCFYVIPQCSTEHRWVEVDWDVERHVLPLQPSQPLAATVELLDALLGGHSIDPQRLYLIGLSMGGFGVWDLLSRWPERFAAAVAICGGADEKILAAARAVVPLWAFHGTQDLTVRVERSRRAVAALRAAGGTPRYTEYPNGDHNAWTPTFAEPDLLPWLFSHRRATT